MNLLKKPFSISLQALAGVLIFSCLLAHPFSEAASSPPGDKRDYMLVLNTYTESAPWSSHIINSIVAHIDQVDNFEVYTENMNSLLMTFKKHKTGEIESFKNNLLREYGKNPPRMLVLLGAPIAVLRDFVKQTWPGVPLILCSEMDYIGPENAYLDRRPLRPEEPLCDKAVSDNITLIRTPLYLRENVELMRRMIPGMDSLIFVGDGRYINQQADSDLRELLDREFPQIDYRFYSAHEMSTEALLDSLNRIDIHRTGILFSSWHYTKKIGDNIVSVTDSYRVIASVQAPMFALMPADIRDGGLVGGYVYDDAEVNAHVISTIDAVLAGHQPRDIPFYAPQDARPVFNYAALERKDLSPHTCPANTLFYNKPVSTLEQYKWAIGGIVLLLLLAFIGIQQWRIRMMYRVESARQRESESLAKYSNLFNAMPIVYIQMKVIYDENGNPADALYCDVNSRYERIFIPREQAIGRRVSELFPFPMTEFMRLIKIAQTENRTITYPYYYEPRDIFYEVVISRSYLEEHIDIFCLDGTALYKTQQKLDSINHKLAMALDVADIVPWKWDLRKGSILCDVNKSVHGQMLAGTNADQQLEVPSESYFAKIHKEDRERVRRAYDDLIAGRKDKVREEYRVASDAGGRWHLDWVEAQATVDQRDDDGRPLNLIGSSLVITPRKRLEQDLRSARDRAEESNRLKSAFLANMSHEIRTPLNAIVGFSSILAETDEEQEKREYISIIENNNALLLQLIGDILDLSKIEAGTLEFNFSDFELNELMHEKENIIRMKTAEGVELIFEPGLDACLFHSDRNRLSQLLINLLTNAAKFTAKGSSRFGQPAPFLRLRHGLRHSARRAAADFRPVRQTQLLQTGHGTRASDLQKHCRTSRRRDRCEVGRRARHDLLVHASLRHRQALRNPVRGDPDGFGRKGQTDDPHCRGQRQQLPSLRNDPAPRLPADTRPGRGAGRRTVPHGTSAPDSHGHQHARDERLRGRGGNPQIRGGNPDRRRHGLRLRLRRAEDHAERIHGLHAQADQRPAAQKTDSRHPAGTHHADMKR